MYTTVGALCLWLRDLKSRPILQQMELLGRPIGAIVYSKVSRRPSIAFMDYTSVFRGTVKLFLVKRPLSLLLMLFCILAIVRGCCAITACTP